MDISLDKNDSVLITKRLQKQELVIYFSNLAGSILGVLGSIGFILNIIEKYYEFYMKNRITALSLKHLIQSNYSLSEKNFATLPIIEKAQTNHTDSHLNSLEYFNITMNNKTSTDDLHIISTDRDREIQYPLSKS